MAVTAKAKHHITENIEEADFITTFAYRKNIEGVDISIVGCMELFPLPESDGGIRGAIYLNGDVIPIVDMQMKANCGSTNITGKSCILLLEHFAGGKKYKVGLIVTDISEVLNIISGKMDDESESQSNICRDGISNIKQPSDLSEILINADQIIHGIKFEDFG